MGKLERNGSIVSASVSGDGVAWTVVDTATLDLPSTLYAGLALTSHSAGAVAQATFSNVSVTP